MSTLADMSYCSHNQIYFLGNYHKIIAKNEINERIFYHFQQYDFSD